MKEVFVFFKRFVFFWFFLILFKLGAGLHYTLMSPLGERVFPIWLVGILIGGVSLLQLILDVPAGFILDRFGYRKFLKITTFVFMIASLSLCFGLNEMFFLITLITSCFGWLFFGPGVNAYLLSHASKENTPLFISFRDTFESLGIVLSSALFSIVLFLDTKIMGLIIFVFLLVAFIFISLAPKDTESVHKEKKIETQHYYIKRRYLKHILKVFGQLNPASTMLILMGLAGSIFYSLIWFVVPLIIAHNQKSGYLNLGLGIFDFAVVTLGFILGRIASKFNKQKLVFLGLLIFALAGFFIGFNFGILFLILGFLATTGDELAGISLWSWLNILDKNHTEDGLISGIISLFQDLGWAIGPMVAGILYEIVGPSWTIAIGGIFIFSVWSFYGLVLGKLHRKHGNVALSIIKKPHVFRHKR